MSTDPQEPAGVTPLEPARLATVCVVQTMQVGQQLLDRVQKVCQLFGLTLSTANALAIIDGAAEPIAPTTVRERLLITGGAVTQLLDALERRGLIRRVPNKGDRRSVLLEVTPEGRRLRQESEPELNRRDVEWMGGLTVEEQVQLLHLLAKLRTHLASDSAAESDG